MYVCVCVCRQDITKLLQKCREEGAIRLALCKLQASVCLSVCLSVHLSFVISVHLMTSPDVV